jgi:hypothetical protein
MVRVDPPLKHLASVAGILEKHYRQIGYLTPQDVLFERTPTRP